MGEVTMLIPKLSAKHSISVPMMEMEDEPSTVSSVLMELSFNSSTLSVTGGSMLTALLLNSFTLLMMKLLLRELPTHLKVPVVMNIKEELEEEEVLEAGEELVEGEVVQVVLKELHPPQEDHTLPQVEDLEVHKVLELTLDMVHLGLELIPDMVHQDQEDLADLLLQDIPIGEMPGILNCQPLTKT